MNSTNDASQAAPRALRTAAETQALVAASIRRRNRAETRFRAYGLLAVLSGITFVVFLFGTILGQGASVFRQAYMQIPVFLDPEIIDPEQTRDPDVLLSADYQALVRASLRERFPDYGFFGEETGRDRADADYLWLVDPIDGTKSFVRGYPMFSVQIALMHKGELILGVSSAPCWNDGRGETLHAEKGQEIGRAHV